MSSTLRVYPALPHVWQILIGAVPEARVALEEIAGFVKESFTRSTARDTTVA